jgi:hypothetical protein
VTVRASKKAGLFGSGRTEASLTLPHVAFARGAEVPLDVVVENGAKRSVKKVVVKLTRLVYGVAADDPEEEEMGAWQVQQGAAIRSSRPRGTSDAPLPAAPTAEEVALAGGEASARASLSSSTISKFALVTAEVAGGETVRITNRLRLPAGCTPSFSTDVLSLSYALKLVVYFGFGVANLEVLIPIKVLPTADAAAGGDAKDRTISSRELLQSGASRKLAKSYNKTLSRLSLRSESFDLSDDARPHVVRGPGAGGGGGSSGGSGISSTLSADDMAAMMRRASRDGTDSSATAGDPLYDTVPRKASNSVSAGSVPPPAAGTSPDEDAAFPSAAVAAASGRFNTMPAGSISDVVASSLARDSKGEPVITADQLRALLAFAPEVVAGVSGNDGSGSEDDPPPTPAQDDYSLPTAPPSVDSTSRSDPPPLPPVPVDLVLDDLTGESSNAPPAPPSPR